MIALVPSSVPILEIVQLLAIIGGSSRDSASVMLVMVFLVPSLSSSDLSACFLPFPTSKLSPISLQVAAIIAVPGRSKLGSHKEMLLASNFATSVPFVRMLSLLSLVSCYQLANPQILVDMVNLATATLDDGMSGEFCPNPIILFPHPLLLDLFTRSRCITMPL